MNDLYHQLILDLYQDPPHFGELENPDLTLTETNASCGDSFTFYIKLEPSPNKNISPPLQKGELEGVALKQISYTGTGCAISTSATNLLIDHLTGKPISEVKNIDQTLMEELIGTQITPARHKCLMLAAKGINQLEKNLKNSSESA